MVDNNGVVAGYSGISIRVAYGEPVELCCVLSHLLFEFSDFIH